MEQVSVVGLDVAKSVFQVHGINAQGEAILRRGLTRGQLLKQGVKTGSSVIEVQQNLMRAGSSPANQAVRWRVRGEAVAVDLPGGKTLFALLRSDKDPDWASRVYILLAPQENKGFEDALNDVLELTGERTLPRMWPLVAFLEERSAYPLMVTFGDLADPASVAAVNPDDLAATFGEGVKLKRITVELTDDPVTSGIEARLGWWAERAAAGGGLIPMVRNTKGSFQAAPGHDEKLVGIRPELLFNGGLQVTLD